MDTESVHGTGVFLKSHENFEMIKKKKRQHLKTLTNP